MGNMAAGKTRTGKFFFRYGFQNERKGINAMTDLELRKMGRRELQDALMEREEELEHLRSRLVTAEKKLAEREILIDRAGSIAEAALAVNGVFEDAEKAAKQYLENIEKLSSRQESVCAQRDQESREKADRILSDAQVRADRIVEEARKEAAALLSDAKRKTEDTQQLCERLVAEAKQKSDRYWETVLSRMRQYCQSREELRTLLSAGNLQGAVGQEGAGQTDEADAL